MSTSDDLTLADLLAPHWDCGSCASEDTYADHLAEVLKEFIAARVAEANERGDRLEGMANRLAEQHVALQEAVVWAIVQALEWSGEMPRTQENGTYANGRNDGVDATIRIVKAAVSAHLRGEPLGPRIRNETSWSE